MTLYKFLKFVFFWYHPHIFCRVLLDNVTKTKTCQRRTKLKRSTLLCLQLCHTELIHAGIIVDFNSI